ncbi:MAG: hypothetical protein KY467_17025 [Gemmatimonadetes bacterium]|nr:hypothetical protein [Gemmatimonadota bacterium]
MKEPLLLYSTNTWLAYAIAERYYAGVHFAWCSPVYDGTRADAHVNIPPSSSPADLYRLLQDEVERGEQHSLVLRAKRDGLLRGANRRRAEGLINHTQFDDIKRTVEGSPLNDFRPVLYVIPYDRVRGTVVEASIEERAHPFSIEYKVNPLPRDCFDMLELKV